jgi:RNA polymerase sigma factor (sigma-70 family)
MIDPMRKSKTPANSLEESLLRRAADDSGDQMSDHQLQLLAKALATLQPRERILIDLFFRQNLSAQDVASTLHISAGAVYTQKSRILAKLREIIEKTGSL